MRSQLEKAIIWLHYYLDEHPQIAVAIVLFAGLIAAAFVLIVGAMIVFSIVDLMFDFPAEFLRVSVAVFCVAGIIWALKV